MDKKEQFSKFHEYWEAVNSTYEEYARELGVSYSFLHVLCELYNSDSVMTQRRICEVCHLPKTTVNAIITGLMKQGHVLLKELKEDRRQKQIVLTKKGLNYASPIMEHMQESELKAFECIDEETIQYMINGIKEYQELFMNNLIRRTTL